MYKSLAGNGKHYLFYGSIRTKFSNSDNYFVVGIPEMIWFGQEGDQNCLVMELLDKSLEDLFVQQNRKFSLKTVLMLADQMIERI